MLAKDFPSVIHNSINIKGRCGGVIGVGWSCKHAHVVHSASPDQCSGRFSCGLVDIPLICAARALIGEPFRDTERAIDHWRRNTWASDSIPFLETFDFSSMRNEWGHRFLICGGHAVENSVFVTYGINFARLLGLPDKAVTTTPFVQQIPKP